MLTSVDYEALPYDFFFNNVTSHLPALPNAGLLNPFIRHTSCALGICGNWDYEHTLEGADDMPAHTKSIITLFNLFSPDTRLGSPYCSVRDPENLGCLIVIHVHVFKDEEQLVAWRQVPIFFFKAYDEIEVDDLVEFNKVKYVILSPCDGVPALKDYL